ncbi:MAG: 4Fe-4S dicluster domain-containing protein [candidate division WOR-3 bacterium]
MQQQEGDELLLNELDSDFRVRLSEKAGDAGFMHCLACGSCTASCPVRRLDEKYNPRRIIRMAILGLKDEVYRSEFVWLCSYHATCPTRCPQGVNIGEVASALEREPAAQGLQTARACYLCGSCSAVCPEALLDPTRDARRFIRKVNLGLVESARCDEFREICAIHFRCVTRCPQGVQISRIMNAIRQCALEDGYSYPESLAVLERRAEGGER